MKMTGNVVLSKCSSTGRLLGFLLFFLVIFAGRPGVAIAQSASEFFNKAANEYLYKDDKIALNTIESGLSQYPADPALTNLKNKILKEKEKQKQEQQKQDQQKQEQEKKEQEQKDQEKQEQQQKDQEKADNKEDAEKKDQQNEPKPEETEEKGQDMEQPPVSREDKLKDLNLTEEKARMILEAMKNNEIQYIQQNKRKPTKKPDSGKPDW